jgi:Mycobacterial 4 TMS phage holin, superfamily IV
MNQIFSLMFEPFHPLSGAIHPLVQHHDCAPIPGLANSQRVARLRIKITGMIRLLLRVAVFLGSAAIGLVVAALLVKHVHVSVWGFISAVVIFAVAQALLAPLIGKLATRYASAFVGGIGLVSTLLALVLASVLTHGLSISGIASWAGATVVVWLVTALATVVLGKLVVPAKVSS